MILIWWDYIERYFFNIVLLVGLILASFGIYHIISPEIRENWMPSRIPGLLFLIVGSLDVLAAIFERWRWRQYSG